MPEDVHRYGSPDGGKAYASGDGQKKGADEHHCGRGPDEPGDDEHAQADSPECAGRLSDDFPDGTDHEFVDAHGMHGLGQGGDQGDDQHDAEQLTVGSDDGVVQNLNRRHHVSRVGKTDQQDTDHAGNDDFLFKNEKHQNENGHKDEDIVRKRQSNHERTPFLCRIWRRTPGNKQCR